MSKLLISPLFGGRLAAGHRPSSCNVGEAKADVTSDLPQKGRLAAIHPFPILSTSCAVKNLSTTSLIPSSGVKVTIVMPPVALVRVRPSE